MTNDSFSGAGWRAMQRRPHLVLQILPCDLVHGVQVNVHVVVRLDDKLCLLAELADPELSEDALEGEVPVRVHEAALDHVLELLALLFQLQSDRSRALLHIYS